MWCVACCSQAANREYRKAHERFTGERILLPFRLPAGTACWYRKIGSPNQSWREYATKTELILRDAATRPTGYFVYHVAGFEMAVDERVIFQLQDGWIEDEQPNW